MILSDFELRSLLSGPATLVADSVDAPRQLQANAFDLTLRAVYRFVSGPTIGFDNTDRVAAATETLPFDAAGRLFLPPGAYKIAYNEVIHLPLDLCAITLPRSSLFRNGLTVSPALWDAGYRGRGEGLLTVHNPHGATLLRNARLAQLIFIHLSRPATVGYTGQYQNENLALRTDSISSPGPPS